MTDYKNARSLCLIAIEGSFAAVEGRALCARIDELEAALHQLTLKAHIGGQLLAIKGYEEGYDLLDAVADAEAVLKKIS